MNNLDRNLLARVLDIFDYLQPYDNERADPRIRGKSLSEHTRAVIALGVVQLAEDLARRPPPESPDLDQLAREECEA